jgi:hypothetical protein
MSSARIFSREVEQLVRTYTGAASAQGLATEVGDAEAANEASGVLARSFRELRRLGLESALLPLLEHEDPGVRCWAAAHTLNLAPGPAEAVLEALAATPRTLVGFNARMTLDQWRRGLLRFP